MLICALALLFASPICGGGNHQLLPSQSTTNLNIIRSSPYAMIQEPCCVTSNVDLSSFLSLSDPMEILKFKENYGAEADEALAELECLRKSPGIIT